MNSTLKQDAPGAVASLVCGISSIVLAWVPLAGLVLGVVALVMAKKAREAAMLDLETYKVGGLRTGGLVCGIVGTALSGLYNFFWLIMFVIGLAVGTHGLHHF